MTKLDSTLHKDIVDELAFDPKIKERNIAVGVSDGIVTLTGTVESYTQKLDAERAVKRVSGVHGIAEELTVELPLLHQRNDADLAKSSVEALLWNGNVPPESVIVKVEHGWVTLTGIVDWQYQREGARYAIAWLAGVRGISNDISLRHRVIASDVQTKIHDSFRRSAEIDANKINIETFAGTVTLRGAVHSWTERADAASAAYSIPGVIDVKNYTTVT